MIQVKWLHRIYLTPLRLFQMHRLPSAVCSRCGQGQGTLMHMVWECPVISSFWTAVHCFLNMKLGLPNVCSPTNSLLGLVDDIVPSKFGRMLYRVLLFYARKSILLNWKPPKQPSVAHWISLVNADLSMYKLTYAARGVPDRFYQIWDVWFLAPHTAA